MTKLEPGLRAGTLRMPDSKSHLHRVLLADFLAGRLARLMPEEGDCDDVIATKRCLFMLTRPGEALLDCGESGTTRRLLAPVVAALHRTVKWVMGGRLAHRPQRDYTDIKAGLFEMPGDISSQFISGLLFALPLLDGESEIRLTTPLASRGYVEMTCSVLRRYGVNVQEMPHGYIVPGNQRYRAPAKPIVIEADWSGAAFGYALRHLGNDVAFPPGEEEKRLLPNSAQPDRVIGEMLAELGRSGFATVDVDACPDLFPVLAVVAATRTGETAFTGTHRLQLKESDRTAAMADVLARFGVAARGDSGSFVVRGTGKPLRGGAFTAFNDHRIAMSIAVGATRANAPVSIDNTDCASKSYPTFFTDFQALNLCGARA